MPRLLRSAFLMGVLIAAAPLAAQQRSAPKARRGTIDVSVTYGAMLSNQITGGNFWLQGGSVQILDQFYRGWGVVADISGAHIANINSTRVGIDLIAATFGPRYTWSPGHSRYSLFGQGLVGEAWGKNSIFPTSSGPETAAQSLAVKAGGGMNVTLSPHWAVRAFELNWMRTQLPNSTSNVQNNLLFGAGIVFRFR